MQKIFFNHPIWAIIICTLGLFLMSGIICGFIFYPIITLIIFSIIICLALCVFVTCLILILIAEYYEEKQK